MTEAPQSRRAARRAAESPDGRPTTGSPDIRATTGAPDGGSATEPPDGRPTTGWPEVHRGAHRAAEPPGSRDGSSTTGSPEVSVAETPEVHRDDRRAHRTSRAGLLVLLVVVPLALAAFVGLALTWPPSVAGVAASSGLVDAGVHYYRGTVVRSDLDTCQGTQENVLPDGSVPATVPCLQVVATVTQGPSAGKTVTVHPSTGVSLGDVRPGTAVVLEDYPPTDGSAEVWAFSDVERTLPLTTLGLAFVLVTAVVAGWRGLRAIVGLVVAVVVLWVYVIPAIVAGENAVLVTLFAAVAIMTVVGYVTHGFSLRTSTALLGTFAGLGMVAAIGALGVWAARINPITGEQDYQIASVLGSHGVASLRGMFLAGVVLAGLGVLNDVTITQVSAVWELRAARPSAGWRSLFAGGMRIGRDHVASTIYTIAFAYVGASLPVLLLLQLYGLPLRQTLTGGAFAQEIVRTLAGSIGLVLAIPLTTAVAAVVAIRSDPGALRIRGGHSHAIAPA